MVFNSVEFLVFIFVFLLLFFQVSGRVRLWLMLGGSYFFYGWWDWRFLGLIVASTLLDYSLGIVIGKQENEQKRLRLLILSMIMNLGFLGFFKYFNFFADSFATAMASLGIHTAWHTLHIILPVGISFYTFQSMSYTIDVYKRHIDYEPDLLKFSTFIAFFPQLVAGPIVRAKEFLPQLDREVRWDWDRFISGSGQVLWGFFKKVAIADSLAPFVDQVFFDPVVHSSLHLTIGVIFYSFQIYCDFSGYSDIAIGFARLMGYDFPDNFKTPYFSKNFSEFWTRWHISLSSWLRDYLYIPLGGNRQGSFGSTFFLIIFALIPVIVTGSFWLAGGLVLIAIGLWISIKKIPQLKRSLFNYGNLLVTMLLGGLWHGANWTFVFWGFLHGMYLVGQRLIGPFFGHISQSLNIPIWLRTGVNILIVYGLTNLAWVFFRSPDFGTAMEVLSGIASFENFNWANVTNKFWIIKGVLLIGMLLTVEIAQPRWHFEQLLLKNPIFRVVSFALILWLIAFFGTFGANAFIYFQF